MLSVKKIAIEIRSRVVVVFESMELRSADVKASENIIPLAVEGKSPNILLDM
jgi:hypothetical protein